MRIEKIGDCTLYLADCMEVFPTLEGVDACITDPPYGIDYDNAGGFSEKCGWTRFEKLGWDKERPSKGHFDAILGVSRVQIIWGGNYFTDMLPPTMQWLVWDKGQRNFTLADCEFAWSSQWRAARVFDYPRSLAIKDGKRHPTQKPVELMRWCIDQIKPLPETILDPFMGSGKTGVACAKAGKRFIGIEREPSYFDIACQRISDAYKQADLFVAKPKAEPAAPLFLPGM